MTTVASPRIVPVTFPHLREADQYDLDEGPLWEDLEFAGLAFDGRNLTDCSFTGCRLTGVSVEGSPARGVTVTDSRVEGLSVTTLTAAASTWLRSELARTRVGAAELYDSRCDQVTITGCKFGYLNLRSATLTDVVFEDCVFDDLDLMGATLTRVAFRDSRAGMVTLRGAQCADTSMVGLDLGGIDDPSALSGVLVSHEQVLELAPVFAVRAGILVED